MGRKIKFCLLYRDMWQSSGKYVPRVDQLNKVAQPIIDMGCFARVETNGGGFEQINLLFGENPNKAVREWTQPFNDAGIQTQMLERALNGIRMNPVPADVRQLMFRVKKAQEEIFLARLMALTMCATSKNPSSLRMKKEWFRRLH